MSPDQASARTLLHARIVSMIDSFEREGPASELAPSAGASASNAERDALLADLAVYQQRWIPAYARYCAQRPCSWAAPALPTDAFRFARISSRCEASTQRLFHSSGTTQSERSAHAFADLSLYDRAARAAARSLLFPDRTRLRLLILAPREDELTDSSLSYMLARFVAWFGTDDSSYVWPIGAPQLHTLTQIIEQAREAQQPLALLGTSFAFVHALDALAASERRLALPTGSRIMQTGGFKGRSRELSPEAMRSGLSERFALDPAHIVAEYGMTELSSQLYENALRASLQGDAPGARRLIGPPWLRVTVVDPERLTPLPEGRPGLVRIDDAANLDSVSAIQTADVGVMEAGGLQLIGRAQGAVARGCSIRADELLGEPQP